MGVCSVKAVVVPAVTVGALLRVLVLTEEPTVVFLNLNETSSRPKSLPEAEF